MAYLHPASPRRFTPLAGVAIVHLAIGYAFISGLAMQVIPWVPTTIKAELINDTVPPPPNPPLPDTAAKTERPAVLPRTVVVPDVTFVDLALNPVPAEIKVVPPLPPVPDASPAAARDLSRAAAPRGARGGWITTDDYPAVAIRAEQEGAVGIQVRIGSDGRVGECSVARSSGHRALDDATCALYAKRARFEPARDAEGKPTVSSYTDRVVWRLP